MQLNWRKFLQYLLAARRRENIKSLEFTRDMAHAGRLAQADKRGWTSGMGHIERQIGMLDGSQGRNRKREIKADRAALKKQFGKQEK